MMYIYGGNFSKGRLEALLIDPSIGLHGKKKKSNSTTGMQFRRHNYKADSQKCGEKKDVFVQIHGSV